MATKTLIVGKLLYFDATISNGQLLIPAGSQTSVINSTKHIINFTGLPALKSVQVAVVIINSSGVSGLGPVTIASTIV